MTLSGSPKYVTFEASARLTTISLFAKADISDALLASADTFLAKRFLAVQKDRSSAVSVASEAVPETLARVPDEKLPFSWVASIRALKMDLFLPFSIIFSAPTFPEKDEPPVRSIERFFPFIPSVRTDDPDDALIDFMS